MEAGIALLTLRREEQAVKYYARVTSRPDNPVNAVIGKGFFAECRYKNLTAFWASTANVVEELLLGDCSIADTQGATRTPRLMKHPKTDATINWKCNKSDPP